MRKWMRERMKRRKKEPEKTQASDQKPAPLQPDFYGEPGAARPAAEEKETQPEMPESRETEHMAPSPTAAQHQGEKRHPRQPSPQQSEVMSPRDGDVGGGAAAAAVGRDSAARAPHNRQLRPSQPGRDGKRQKRRNPRPPECRRSLR